MIILDNVTHVVGAGHHARKMLSSASLSIPSDRKIVLLGSEVDKKAFNEILSGIRLPTAGRIIRHARVSFPVGYLGGFLAELPIRTNVAHVARLYGLNERHVIEFVERFSGVGDAFDHPYKELPRDLIFQLGQVVSFAIPFDVYLFSREIVLGRNNVNAVLHSLFTALLHESGAIISTRNKAFAVENGDLALVLHEGRISLIEDVEKAFSMIEGPDPNALRRKQVQQAKLEKKQRLLRLRSAASK